MKVCTKCNEDKPLSEYGKRKDSKDGHRNDCKVCRNAEKKAYYEANREKVLATEKARYEANREEILAEKKAYREANREEIAARKKAYREVSREKVAAANKAYYEANREKLKAESRAYREANRDEIAARKKAYHAEKWANDPEYRARYAAAWTRRDRMLDSAVQEPYLREEIFERDNWTCQLCQEPIDPELKWPESGFASIDHIVPISLGGDDTPDNVQAAHLSCNQGKGNRVGNDQAMLTGVAG